MQSKKVKREVLKAEAILAVKKEYGLDVNDDIAEAILLTRSAFDLPKIELSDEDFESIELLWKCPLVRLKYIKTMQNLWRYYYED